MPQYLIVFVTRYKILVLSLYILNITLAIGYTFVKYPGYLPDDKYDLE